MFVSVFVASLAISAATPAPAGKGSSFPGRSTPVSTRTTHLVASDAYALRARRRFAAYLRLRLLEMREAGLERAAEVVERRLPVDDLVGKRRSP